MNLTPTDPVLVVSDLHLGHRASSVRDVNRLQTLVAPFRTAIFNGDTAEMRHASDRPLGRKMAGDLARVCHRAGCKAIFINGNHDPTISDLNHLDLHDGALLVTHGDILFLGVAPWSRDAKHYLSAHRRFLAELGEDAYGDFEKRLLATKRASIELQLRERPLTRGPLPGLSLIAHQLWPPHRPFKIVHAWQRTPTLAAELTAFFRPQARFTLIGHTHYPGIWRRHDRTIINTGASLRWMGALGVIIEGNRLEVRSLRRQNGGLSLGKIQAAFRIT